MKHIIYGNIGQWLACIFLGAGLTLIIISPWDVSRTLITLGSVIFSAATKLKLIGYELEEHRSKGKRP